MSLVEELRSLKKRGFVGTGREGDTGVGKTFEDQIGVTENNRRGPDYNSVELKATRRESSCSVTLFTREPPKSHRRVWNDRLIDRFGYTDSDDRQALKITLHPDEWNAQDMRVRVDGRDIHLDHRETGRVASYPLSFVREAAEEKLPELVLVLAETRTNAGTEEFWYNEAYHLSGFDADAFIECVRDGRVVVELRMHLKESGATRNHGTAWRLTREDALHQLYESVDPLLADDTEASSIAEARGWRQAGLSEY